MNAVDHKTSLSSLASDMRQSLLSAARDGFRSLPTIKGLEHRIASLVQKARTLDPPKPMSSMLDGLEKAFTDFENAQLPQKQKAILKALDLLDSGISRWQALDCETEIDRRPLMRSTQYLKGVGPKVAELLAEKGIVTVEDLLYLLPNRYEDRSDVVKIAAMIPGTFARSEGEIIGMGNPAALRFKKPFEVLVQDESGVCTLSWFHYGGRAIPQKYSPGDRICFAGKVGIYRGRFQIVHPEVSRPEEEDEAQMDALGGISRIKPVYPEIQGINKQKLRFIIQRAAGEYSGFSVDHLPDTLRSAYRLSALGEALKSAHMPDENADTTQLNSSDDPARRRLIFDEFFFMQLAMAQRRSRHSSQPGVAFKPYKDLARRFYANFEHRLTEAQRRVTHEIATDMQKAEPMNRLLQGDVGSGKTVVAVLCALMAIENGYQVALMAPTEILAEQHYRTVSGLCNFEGVNVGLLLSRLKSAAKNKLLNEIAIGHVNFVIGTHALIQKGVDFRKLGFVIIDEQHRFGVEQRSALRSKGVTPHCLVMSATPIPRSMSLTLYGDLDVSILDEIPPGRTPIKTHVSGPEGMAECLRTLRAELAAGRQAYIVYPLVEESEKLIVKSAVASKLKWEQDLLPGYRIGLLHGQMPAEEKELVMQRFNAGEYDALVTTSVVEVGVDVQNATVMIIEDAQRFGLAQLHQLRGRVGRGRHPGHCFLVAGEDLTAEALERLSILEMTSNGFRIAEADLAMRGPGEFLGTRQTGAPALQIADLVRDSHILEDARKAAFELIASDPELKKPEHALISARLNEHWGEKFDLVQIG